MDSLYLDMDFDPFPGVITSFPLQHLVILFHKKEHLVILPVTSFVQQNRYLHNERDGSGTAKRIEGPNTK